MDPTQAASFLTAATKYLPQNAATGVGVFQDVMSVVQRLGGAAIGGVPQHASGDFGALLQMQIEAQKELQSTTMISNIERSKHESKMAAIRNIRVS